MSTVQDLSKQYLGQIVPFSFHAGFVSLSYVVSLIGAGSTLELISRRTSHKGIHNQILLAGAAISMGGIAIWSMHFIGNRAIYILDGQDELQIAYSTRLTILSLFVPILVLLLAFLVVSSNHRMRWWRIGLSGSLSGLAICGMHYLGNASINNYRCSYEIAYVVAAALIAVAASTTALALFFVFQAAWTNAWWRRAGCAMVLAGAVSGMHWCAAAGTRYTLLHPYSPRNGTSRDATTIVVICLSVGAFVVMATSWIYSAWIRRSYASKAQQIVLAAAAFDKRGRILVSQEGLLPSEVVTDTFLQKSNNDVFGTTHPLFHWMFRASRNWSSITNIIDRMTNHIGYLSHGRRNNRTGIKLMGEDGLPIEEYDVIFRELFCLAAVALASKLRENLLGAGILWDEIFATGSTSKPVCRPQMELNVTGDSDPSLQNTNVSKKRLEPDDLVEKGDNRIYQENGRGSLMFLVRHVDSRRDVEKLETAGYRFAELHQVVGIIRSSMKIKTPDLGGRLRNMAIHSENNAILTPGVYLSIFAVRARLDRHGFDVLVQKNARNLLPTTKLPLEYLERWQIEFLGHFQGLTPSTLIHKLNNMKSCSAQEVRFKSELCEAIVALRGWFDDATFDDATLMSKVVQVPCSPLEGSSRAVACSLITFQLVLPIHTSVSLPRCEFSPLQFFKIRQLVYKGSPHHVAFSRSVHRELSCVLHNAPPGPLFGSGGPRFRGDHEASPRRWLARFDRSTTSGRVDNNGLDILTTSQEHLWNMASSLSSSRNPGGESSVDRDQKPPSIGHAVTGGDTMAHPTKRQQLYGGIMVSQEIVVDVQEKSIGDTNIVAIGNSKMIDDRTEISVAPIEVEDATAWPVNLYPGVTGRAFNIEAEKEEGESTFVDELLALCMDKQL
ncbi:putative MHYT domain signaling protein [Ilyonectria destructans]|nr:putative MHYT domain signaling protein [Ilyonectria destructans]